MLPEIIPFFEESGTREESDTKRIVFHAFVLQILAISSEILAFCTKINITLFTKGYMSM